jgi:hypothetical protein
MMTKGELGKLAVIRGWNDGVAGGIETGRSQNKGGCFPGYAPVGVPCCPTICYVNVYTNDTRRFFYGARRQM